MNLVQNIIDNYNFLKIDFIGIHFYFSGILQFFVHIFITVVIFLHFYFIGKLINKYLFDNNGNYKNFVELGLGYIAVATGIGILGALSLFKQDVIIAYLLTIFLFAFCSAYFFLKEKKIFKKINFKKKINYKKNILFICVLLFALLAFLRLIPPETAEDTYHTDLPKRYLSLGTSIYPSKELQHVIPYPQLPEMTYLIVEFVGDREAARFIHFGFYLVIILFLFRLSKEKEYSFTKFVPLIFVTTPLVMRYASSQYTDFFMLFCFLLSIFFLKKNMTQKELILAGIFFGGVLSAKMWMLIYLPIVICYLFILERSRKRIFLKNSLIFCLAVLLVVGLWYIRAYSITGNPIYPIFSLIESPDIAPLNQVGFHSGFNKELFSYQMLVLFSPLFFLGLVFFPFWYKESIKKVMKTSLCAFFIFFFLEQLFIPIFLGRYLVSFYTFFSIIISATLLIAFTTNIFTRYILILFSVITFGYFFLNTIFILPYGLGWANTNNYLTRVLGRDNVSYYDFDHRFDKWIKKDDLVATYGVGSFYYAHFRYVDVGYIFGKGHRSFLLLKRNHIAKLLVKGGNILYFCKQLGLRDCSDNQVRLLATYPDYNKNYNLYQIK